MVKAIINNSEVTLEKDCHCHDHDGPCWLHQNNQWRERNMEIDSRTPLGFMAKAKEEISRLEAKAFYLQLHHIQQLLP